jgi:hypothetical protein
MKPLSLILFIAVGVNANVLDFLPGDSVKAMIKLVQQYRKTLLVTDTEKDKGKAPVAKGEEAKKKVTSKGDEKVEGEPKKSAELSKEESKLLSQMLGKLKISCEPSKSNPANARKIVALLRPHKSSLNIFGTFRKNVVILYCKAPKLMEKVESWSFEEGKEVEFWKALIKGLGIFGELYGEDAWSSDQIRRIVGKVANRKTLNDDNVLDAILDEATISACIPKVKKYEEILLRSLMDRYLLLLHINPKIVNLDTNIFKNRVNLLKADLGWKGNMLSILVPETIIQAKLQEPEVTTPLIGEYVILRGSHADLAGIRQRLIAQPSPLNELHFLIPSRSSEGGVGEGISESLSRFYGPVQDRQELVNIFSDPKVAELFIKELNMVLKDIRQYDVSECLDLYDVKEAARSLGRYKECVLRKVQAAFNTAMQNLLKRSDSKEFHAELKEKWNSSVILGSLKRFKDSQGIKFTLKDEVIDTAKVPLIWSLIEPAINLPTPLSPFQSILAWHCFCAPEDIKKLIEPKSIATITEEEFVDKLKTINDDMKELFKTDENLRAAISSMLNGIKKWPIRPDVTLMDDLLVKFFMGGVGSQTFAKMEWMIPKVIEIFALQNGIDKGFLEKFTVDEAYYKKIALVGFLEDATIPALLLNGDPEVTALKGRPGAAGLYAGYILFRNHCALLENFETEPPKFKDTLKRLLKRVPSKIDECSKTKDVPKIVASLSGSTKSEALAEAFKRLDEEKQKEVLDKWIRLIDNSDYYNTDGCAKKFEGKDAFCQCIDKELRSLSVKVLVQTNVLPSAKDKVHEEQVNLLGLK